MSPQRRTSFSDLLRCIVAAGGAALVLALSVFAASPVAHNWLHADSDHATREHGCAVVLFADGVSLPLDPLAVPLPIEATRELSPSTAAEVFLISPRYLRQPERGPPSDC